MSENVVELRDVSKRYLTGTDFQSYDTVREALHRATRFKRKSASQSRDFWALHEINLDVARGEVLGIVGANGAGKTTLLKIVSRITEPTRGVARTRGKLGALLDLGTGFHPELSGRENIFLGGAILGMSRRDIQRRFSEISEFSGVGRFLDTPLKRYSAGMRLRLAFSVAAHLDVDILAVDEVLAVGDAEFQRKSLGKVAELPHLGKTAIFVSHDLGAVTRLCTRAVWLDQGRIRDDGEPEDVVRTYLRASRLGVAPAEFSAPADAPAYVTAISLEDESAAAVSTFERGDPIVVRLSLAVIEPVRGLDLAVYVVNDKGVRVLDEAWLDQVNPPELGSNQAVVKLNLPPLLAPGTYSLGVWLGASGAVFQEEAVVRFEVLPCPGDRIDDRSRVTQPSVVWSLETYTAGTQPGGLFLAER